MPGSFLALVFGAGSAFALLVVITLIAKNFLRICEPHEILVFSGRKRTLPDGSTVGYRIVTGGLSFKWPVIEKVERMDARNIPIDIRISNAYSKGASVLQMLRVLVGEEPFWRGIHRYTTDNKDSNVETADLRRAMEEESGLHLDWFFDQWVYSAGHPKLVGHRDRRR